MQTRLSAADAVRWVAEAIDAEHRGELIAPPRAHADLGEAVWSSRPGDCEETGLATAHMTRSPPTQAARSSSSTMRPRARSARSRSANELGARRTGAIGAVAADTLAPPDAGVVAVVGTGVQGWCQVWALSGVRALREVRVYSRDRAKRASFADRIQTLTTAPCRPAPDVRAGARRRDRHPGHQQRHTDDRRQLVVSRHLRERGSVGESINRHLPVPSLMGRR